MERFNIPTMAGEAEGATEDMEMGEVFQWLAAHATRVFSSPSMDVWQFSDGSQFEVEENFIGEVASEPRE